MAVTLVVGLVIREAGAELVIGALLGDEPRRLAQLALGRDLDQLARHLADALLHARLAGLPGAAAEPVELDRGLLRAVARQQLDVLDRQEQLVVAGVVDLETVVRRAGRLDGLEPDEAADAVIDMHDEIAGRQAGQLGDEILRALGGAARPHQAVAQDVLLADDRGLGGLESGLEAEHRERRPRAAAAPARPASWRRCTRLTSRWSASTWLMRSRAPSLHSAIDDALAGVLQRLDVLACTASNTLPSGLRALGREIAARAGAGVDHAAGALRHRERRQPHQRRRVEPLRAIPPRRDRAGPAAAACRAGSRRPVERLPARLVVVGDLGEPLLRGVLGQRLDRITGVPGT